MAYYTPNKKPDNLQGITSIRIPLPIRNKTHSNSDFGHDPGWGRSIAVAPVGIGVNELVSGKWGDPSTLLSSPTQEELRRAAALLRHAAEGLRRAIAAR
jgi:hypothetical protein